MWKRNVSTVAYGLLIGSIFLTVLSCKETSEFSKGGVCLSFDDRSINEWYAIDTIFQKFNARATFFITQFDSLTEDEIGKLAKLQGRGHEIGSHGAIHVLSENYIKEFGYSSYLANEIDHSISAMSEAGFRPQVFAYPYGAKYWFTDYLLLKRFKVLRTVAKINRDHNIAEMDEIFADGTNQVVSALEIDVGSKIGQSDIAAALKRAKDNNVVLMLYGHAPINPLSSDQRYRFDPTFLEYIVKEAHLMGLEFYTASQLLSKK